MSVKLLTPEEADQEINKRAMVVFRDFRYREGPTWYRFGPINAFSEFTLHPSTLLTGNWAPPQMDSGRSTGIASGQYAYSTPPVVSGIRSDRQYSEIVGPSNPFIVSCTKRGDPPGIRFRNVARTLFRLAETVGGVTDWSQPMEAAFGASGLQIGSFPISDVGRFLADPFMLAFELKNHGYNDLPSYQEIGERIVAAIYDWNDHKQVHPLNILLSRLGFDGVSWSERAKASGDTEDYGSLLFPPISYMGKVVGLNPTKSRYMYLP